MYLIRSMGTIYGVTVTSAIVQNVLSTRLPEALGDAATEEVGGPWLQCLRLAVVADCRVSIAHRKAAKVALRAQRAFPGAGAGGPVLVLRRTEDCICGVECVCAASVCVFVGTANRVDGEEMQSGIDGRARRRREEPQPRLSAERDWLMRNEKRERTLGIWGKK